MAPGQPVAVVHARDEWTAGRGREMVAGCLRIAPDPVPARRWCWQRGGAVPELPEVETIRRQLAERLPGRTIARASRSPTPCS